MSNEELVAVIQAGETERMGELWEQVAGLVKWKAKRIMTVLDAWGGRGVEFDDLYHSGYPALVEAVETYDRAAGGAFSSWFMFYLKSAFAATTGFRTRRGQNEPLNNALSLDTPLTDDSDSGTMMEVVADPDGQQLIQTVEDTIFQQQLHDALETVLAEIPEQYSEVLRLRYMGDMTLSEVGQLCGVGYESIRKMELKALREIRRPRYTARLRPFWCFDYYSGAGLGAFKKTGMSIQEKYLIGEEDRLERDAQRNRERERKKREEQLRKEAKAHLEQGRQAAMERISRWKGSAEWIQRKKPDC